MKKILLFSILLLSLLTITSCKQEIDLVDFSISECDDTIDPYDESNLGVKDIQKDDSGNLIVTAYVTINCVEEIDSLTYEIKDNTIELQFTAPKCEICADCLCTKELTYMFKGIEMNQYEFTVNRIYE